MGAIVSFENAGAPLDAARLLAEAGIRRSIAGAVTPANGPAAFFINVDSGTTSLRVDVAPDASGAETTLYLYDCADKRCAIWDAGIRPERRNALLVANPRPGPWKVLVDVPKRGRAPFTYTEVMTHPKYGNASSQSEVSARGIAAAWKAPVVFRAGETPPLGYELVGVADVTDPAMEEREVSTPLGSVKPWIPSYRPVRLGSAIVKLEGARGTIVQAGSPKSPKK